MTKTASRLAAFVRAPEHSKVVKIDASDSQIFDIAAYLHSRVVYASGRGEVHVSEILVGDAKAGEQYFNGAGGCNKCHSPTGDLKGVGAKYDAATLQERLVMPRAGRGGFGRGAAVQTRPRRMQPSRCPPAKPSKARRCASPTSM